MCLCAYHAQFHFEARSLPHLGGPSSPSQVRSIFAALTSRRLSWSASGWGAGGSSSSSWVGCLEHSIVSSVMQLEIKSTVNRLTIYPVNMGMQKKGPTWTRCCPTRLWRRGFWAWRRRDVKRVRQEGSEAGEETRRGPLERRACFDGTSSSHRTASHSPDSPLCPDKPKIGGVCFHVQSQKKY